MSIQDMVDQYLDEARAQKDQRDARIIMLVMRGMQALPELLGESVFAELQPFFGEPDVDATDINRNRVEVAIPVDGPKISMRPFGIVIKVDGDITQGHFSASDNQRINLVESGRFFARELDLFPAWVERHAQRLVEVMNIENRPEKIAVLRDQLIGLWPARSADWQAAADERLALLRRRDEQLQRDAQERAAREESEKGVLEAYEHALVEFYRNRRQINERNDAKIQALQAQFDQPVDVYVLKYAVVAVDEDTDEHFAEVHQVYANRSEPVMGWWEIYEEGRLSQNRFHHPVSVTKKTLRPTELHGDVFRYRQVLPGVGIWHHYSADPDALDRAIAELDLEPQIEEPAKPEGIDYYDLERARLKAVDDVVSDDLIPF